MKHLNKSRTMLLLMVLLSSLSTFAQNSMVGDGFGGRPGYDPVNYANGGFAAFSVCGANKQLYAWGSNIYQSFGTGTSVPIASDIPFTVPNMQNVQQFSIGLSCSAIKNDGSGWVWGRLPSYTPVTNVISDAYFTSAGDEHVSFVKKDGTVWSVGGNSTGQFGNGTTNTSTVLSPVQMSNITNAIRVACGGRFTVILLSDGTVKQTGDESPIPPPLRSRTPVTVTGLPNNIVDIKAGWRTSYALTATGELYSWGSEDNNCELGRGVLAGAQMPGKVIFPSGITIKAISTHNGTNSILALADNGDLYAFGLNNLGQLGNGTTVNANTPTLITSGVRDIIMGAYFSYIVKTDGSLWATGFSPAGGFIPGPGNIFMNLSNTERHSFTQITPTGSPMNLCAPTSFTGMPPCVAGTTAPAVTPTTATNSCPTTTVNLASLAISSTTPSGASLIWSTHKTPTSAADTLTTAQKTAVSTAGTYYAMYYDATNACYSPADSVTITITNCVAPLTANTPAAQTATTGTAKTGNAATELAPTGGVSPYIYSNGAGNAACVAPSGATALTGLTVNANGSYSYTAPTTAGTYYYCIKVCDSATPTASCIVKTYTLTVSPPACTVTGITPTIIKN